MPGKAFLLEFPSFLRGQADARSIQIVAMILNMANELTKLQLSGTDEGDSLK
jgi:hypothetical protein